MTLPTQPDSAAPIAAPLKKTALNATHRALKAKMVDFGGWDMPVEYRSPDGGLGGGLIAEHLAVRTGVGLFDVSHMGEVQFRGPGALAAVQHITMNDASKLKDGQAQYSALLTPEGTFVDDILVHRLSENDYLLVVNAGPRRDSGRHALRALPRVRPGTPAEAPAAGTGGGRHADRAQQRPWLAGRVPLQDRRTGRHAHRPGRLRGQAAAVRSRLSAHPVPAG